LKNIESVTIMNLLGEMVYSNVISPLTSQISVDLSDHPKGIYFVKILVLLPHLPNISGSVGLDSEVVIVKKVILN